MHSRTGAIPGFFFVFLGGGGEGGGGLGKGGLPTPYNFKTN